MNTNVPEFIGDLEGGVLEQKLSHILSEVASGVIDHNKAGKVTIDFNIKRIGNSYQVEIAHKLSYKKPTTNGDISENNLTATPMYVGSGGKLSLFPEGQDQMFDKKGKVNQTNGETA